jgi:hypothetical protein
LKSTRCKAVYTGSIPVVAFRFACNWPVVVQAIVVSPIKALQTAQKAVYIEGPAQSGGRRPYAPREAQDPGCWSSVRTRIGVVGLRRANGE